MKYSRNIGKYGLPLITAVAVSLFFGLCYPNHLHYQEQYQLFLFTADYALDVILVPGGVADYLGRFLTQYFLYTWAGASILAIIIALCQYTIGQIYTRTTPTTDANICSSRPLALLPTALLWLFLCNENALLSGAVALLLSLVALLLTLKISNTTIRHGVFALSSPLLYLALGPVAALYPTLYTLLYLKEGNHTSKNIPTPKRHFALFSITFALVTTSLLPWIMSLYVNRSAETLYISAHYFRFPGIVPKMLWTAVWAIPLLLLVGTIMPNKKIITWFNSVIALGASVYMIAAFGYEPAKEEIFGYDFMARTNKWNEIIAQAERKTPKNQVSVTALNLALGLQGQLGNKLFTFEQNGWEGLLPTFQRDPLTPLVTAEAFLKLGMVNTAQRFFFEAQEAIPDYQKSARCTRRLAETNLIMGNYEVARKYLQMLTHTLAYAGWAERTMTLLGDEEAINEHPQYGALRKKLLNDDFFFSDAETPKMLGRLFLSNPKNKMAYEYLQAAYLLAGDLDNFVRCIDLGRQYGYQNLSVSSQEALIMWWSQTHAANEPMPAEFSPMLVQNMHSFIAKYQQNAPREQIEKQFGKSYWYYYLFEKP